VNSQLHAPATFTSYKIELFWTYLVTELRLVVGARGSIVVKALCYKPEGHGFET
jgi:hypothetical protein